MGQTILCEYIAAWEETGEQPDPAGFEFNGVLDMLQRAQRRMFELGTSANDWNRKAMEYQRSYKAVSRAAIEREIEYKTVLKDTLACLENLNRLHLFEAEYDDAEAEALDTIEKLKKLVSDIGD